VNNNKKLNYISEKNEYDFLKPKEESYATHSRRRSILLNKDEKAAANLGNQKKLSFNLPINYINYETIVAGYTSHSSREPQAAYDLQTYSFSNLSSKIENKNIIQLDTSATNDLNGDFGNVNENNLSSKNTGSYATASASFLNNIFYQSKQSSNSAPAGYCNYNTYNNNDDNGNKFILSQDDLIKNEPNQLISENLFKIKPHHEARKYNLRLGTIMEVVESEKERNFLRSTFSNLNLLKNKKENLFIKNNFINNINPENKCISKLDSEKLVFFEKIDIVNCKESTGIDNKKNISRYSSLNIRDIIKDKEKFEKINLQSRCNTEGIEDDDSSKGIYRAGNNLSMISSMTDTLSAQSLSAKKNSSSIKDKDKTPV
jgi:hypothetical protein